MLNKDVRLKHYQKEGQQKLIDNNGMVLFNWRPGAGKTLGAVAAVEKLKENKKAKTALIVVPAPLKTNFIEGGVHQFTDQKAIELTTKPGKTVAPADYYVVSKELFRKHPNAIAKATKADTLVIDELDDYKNMTSSSYGSIMEVRPQFKNFIGLSGTPINNHPREIVPLADIVTNKAHTLGDASQFNKKYMGRKMHKEGPLSFIGIGSTKVTPYVKHPARLKRDLNPFIHTYQQPDDSTPVKKITNIDVPMSSQQHALYNYVIAKTVDPITLYRIKKNLPVNQREAKGVFDAIIKARQVSSSLYGYDRHTSLERAAQTSPKIKTIIEDVRKHLKESPKNKVIIYSNLYTGSLDVMSAGLTKYGIKHGIFTGTTHTKRADRDRDVEQYLKGSLRVMLVNTAGVKGLNLPGTTWHVAMDGHFNPALMEQGEARGIRSGSPVKEVEVRRYKAVIPRGILGKIMDQTFMKGLGKDFSVDEWIYTVADEKEKLNNQVKQLL